MSTTHPTTAYFDLHRLHAADLVQLAGATLVAASLLMPWYATDAGNANANIDGRTGDVTGWTAHPVLRWVILAALVSAFISAWQTVRAHPSSWERGEIAVVVALVVVVLVLFVGFVTRPGEPSGAIHLAIGWFAALAGALLAVGAAVARQPRRRRRPPGL
jgi:hypothetical protein